MNREIKFYDGDYEIIFSNIFNIYDNTLIIEKIAGFKVEFKFLSDTESAPKIETSSDNSARIMTIKLFNFNSSLGVGTIKRLPIINLEQSQNDQVKQIYFSIHSKSLDNTTGFLQISVTFYLK